MGALKIVPKRVDVDSNQSQKSGVAGFFESFLRSFRNLAHLILLLPVYGLGCFLAGTAATPALLFFRWAFHATEGMHFAMRGWLLAMSLGACYFMFGMCLIMVVPAFNFIFRTHLHAWRGPYYSLESIKWYIHNGTTYMVRYSFLEMITPTPFNLLYFKAMGMKIGRGTAINSSCISDPSLISLGEKVTIGGSATIVGHYGQGGFLILAPVKIGNNVTIGLKATIMGGVEIGDGAKVMANSVVLPKTIIPAGETWAGVPAVKISG